tara:strand:+ start:329 stop:526 length:198 start_codon:yes stop_codon:yes gene_type:complete
MKQEINHYLQGLEMPKKREGDNLSYCTLCKTVYETYWGFHYGSMEKKHHDMPTYGLKRKSCNECK